MPRILAAHWHRLMLCALLGLAACSTYHPAPLTDHPRWPSALDRLTVERDRLPFAELRAQPFDPSNGLDRIEVAMLAVSHNPDLVLARDDAGIAHAQAFAAGLLPNPQIGVAVQVPQTQLQGQDYTAYDYGLGIDLMALVQHASQSRGAEAEAHKTDLLLLWQETQVITAAEQLFVRIRTLELSLQWWQRDRDLWTRRVDRQHLALAQGNQNAPAVAADALALEAIEHQINDAQRELATRRSTLNDLLGLPPEARPVLTGPISIPALDDRVLDQRLDALPRSRADLLALAAGYQASEAHLQQAVLAQFPALGVGLSRSGDNTGIPYNGFFINFDLPIFNHNQGGIAIQQATRQRLQDEYQNRLNSAHSEIHQLLQDQTLLEARQKRLEENLPAAGNLAKQAQQALEAGNLDLIGAVTLEDQWINRHLELLALDDQIAEQRIALYVLLGLAPPPENPSP